VDVLDRPDLSGNWEEIWRSLKSIEFFDLDQVITYALLLGNATTAAKVGFFLDQHKEVLMVEDVHLEPLRRQRPRHPHYFVHGKRQARDLFDGHQIFTMEGIDRGRLRLAFVVYGGMNRKDWRTVSIADVDFDPDELARLLIPTLNRRFLEKQGSPAEYGEGLVTKCQAKLEAVLPFSDPEREFLDLLLEKGEIEVEWAPVRALPQALGTYRPGPLRQHGYLTTHSEPPRVPERETDNLWARRGWRQLVAWFRFAAESTQPCFTIAERAAGTR
jgi:hypothetical protein